MENVFQFENLTDSIYQYYQVSIIKKSRWRTQFFFIVEYGAEK